MARPKKRQLPTADEAVESYDLGLKPQRQDTDKKYAAELSKKRAASGTSGNAAASRMPEEGDRVWPWDSDTDRLIKLGISKLQKIEKAEEDGRLKRHEKFLALHTDLQKRDAWRMASEHEWQFQKEREITEYVAIMEEHPTTAGPYKKARKLLEFALKDLAKTRANIAVMPKLLTAAHTADRKCKKCWAEPVYCLVTGLIISQDVPWTPLIGSEMHTRFEADRKEAMYDHFDGN